MDSCVCSIAKNITSGTHNGAKQAFTMKQVCEMRYKLSEWPENVFIQAVLVLMPCNIILVSDETESVDVKY